MVVILDIDEYRRKMTNRLCNNVIYRNLSMDSLKIVSKVVSLSIKSNSTINSISHKLIENNPLIMRVFGILKIHKEWAPLIPIVNTICGPSYLLAKYLARNLKPLVGHTNYFIMDSSFFVNELRAIKFEPCDIMVIFLWFLLTLISILVRLLR